MSPGGQKLSKNLDVSLDFFSGKQNYPLPLRPVFKCILSFLSLFPGTFAGRGMGKEEQLQIPSH